MPSSLLFLLLSSVFFNCIGSPVLAGRKVRDTDYSSSDVVNKKEVDELKKELLNKIDDVEEEVTPVADESNVDEAYKKFLRLENNKKSVTKKEVQSRPEVPTTKPPKRTTISDEIVSNSPTEQVPTEPAVEVVDDDKGDEGIALEENDNAQVKNEDIADDAQISAATSKESDKVNRQESDDDARGLAAPQPQAMKSGEKDIRGKDFETNDNEMDDIYFIIIVAGCSVAGIAGLMLAGYCWYKLHNTQKQVNESEYKGSAASRRKSPTSINKAPGDEKLDYNAEMYHYQHTKNQISAMEKAKAKTLKGESLEDEDEDDDVGDEGEDDTVYECPGLAPAGDMTVMNPLFSDPEAHASDDTFSAQSSPQTPRAKPKH